MGENDIVEMPLSFDDLLVLMRCLKTGLESEQTKTSDREVISQVKERIARFVERQGAFWDKPGNQGRDRREA